MLSLSRHPHRSDTVVAAVASEVSVKTSLVFFFAPDRDRWPDCVGGLELLLLIVASCITPEYFLLRWFAHHEDGSFVSTHCVFSICWGRSIRVPDMFPVVFDLCDTLPNESSAPCSHPEIAVPFGRRCTLTPFGAHVQRPKERKV